MFKMSWRTLIFRPTFFASSCENGQRAGGKCRAKNADKHSSLALRRIDGVAESEQSLLG